MNALLLLVIISLFFEIITAGLIYRPFYVALANSRSYRHVPQYTNSNEDKPYKMRIVYQPLSFVLLNKMMQAADENSLSGYLQDMYGKIPSVEFSQIFNNFGAPSDITDSSNIKTESESQSDENKSQEEKHSENTENGWKYFPNYETYSHYYKYAKKVFAVGVFFIPVLGEYEAFMLGLHLLDVAWKTAHMYRKGESWMSIAAHIGKYVLKRRRRDVAEIMSDTTEINQFVDISSVDTETFVNIVRVMDFPPLPDYYEKVIRKDVTNIINKYMKNNDVKGDSNEIIEFFERLVKFVALHGTGKMYLWFTENMLNDFRELFH